MVLFGRDLKKGRTNEGHLLNIGLLRLSPCRAAVVPSPQLVAPFPVALALSLSFSFSFATTVSFSFPISITISIFASAGFTPFTLPVITICYQLRFRWVSYF